jgi:Domain of unknown function (DUF4440)
MNLNSSSGWIACTVLTAAIAGFVLAASGDAPPEQTVAAQRTSADEAKILEIERAWGQAYVKGQLDVISQTLAPDWRGWLDESGWDRAAELAQFKAGRNRSLENIIDQARVRIYGDTAVVEARERVRVADESGDHWITWHITDVFVRDAEKWQVVATHESTIHKPVN